MGSAALPWLRASVSQDSEELCACVGCHRRGRGAGVPPPVRDGGRGAGESLRWVTRTDPCTGTFLQNLKLIYNPLLLQTAHKLGLVVRGCIAKHPP